MILDFIIESFTNELNSDYIKMIPGLADRNNNFSAFLAI